MEIFVLRDGQQTGPFNEDTLLSLCNRGGLDHSDMAWHKGLPGWIPLGEVLKPGSERPTSPPPAPLSGIRPAPKKGATAKQKALLKYLGGSFEDGITKEEAAVVISDALENPKFSARLQKWGEERLKLHADIFQDEIDSRRANRVARYLERCQAEGTEAVKDVTKAHVQVLVESLDKRNPTWERDPKAALWEHLLPAIAEHFPQLVQDGWKDRLKKPAMSKVAAAMTAGEVPAQDSPNPGAFSAAIRGLVYGGVVLALIIGAMWLFRSPADKPAGNPTAKTGEQPKPADPAAAKPPEIPALPAHPTEAPLIAANGTETIAPAPAPVVNAEVVPGAVIAPAPAKPVEAVPAADPTMAATPAAIPPAPTPATPVNPAVALNTPPAPAPVPGVDVPAAPPTAATEPGTPAGPKSLLTVTKSVAVQLQFGKVTLNPGTRVRFIAMEGQNVRVNFNNNVILIPAQATDVDPNALPPAPTTVNVPQPPQPTVAPPAPAPVTPAPATPKPSSDF